MSKRKAQKYDGTSSSTDSDTESAEEVPKKVRQPAKTQPRIRLPTGKRLEIISAKERGIEDPEYQASKSATGKWIVKKRKFPIDQSPRLDTTAGTPALKIEEKNVQEVVEIVPEKKKDDLQLSWINMQATVNDSLKRDLKALSEKYERLAQKEEKRKKETKLVGKTVAPKSAPPPQQSPPPQRTEAPQRTPVQLRAGQYARARPISLSQF
jgi:hypothetical protein